MPIDPMIAQVGLSLAGGLFGSKQAKAGQRVSQEAVNLAKQLYPQAQFNPYTVTTGYGAGGYSPGRLYGQLGGAYGPMQGATSLAATSLIPSIIEQSQRTPEQFTQDIAGRQQEIFADTSAQLQPAFQQQATDLQSRLFGGGRLGLRLAGESQGLGAGSGMVQPDALGLGRAQQQTLAQLGTQARQQALGEEAQRYQQFLGNQNLRQQQLQNLMGAQSGLFTQALGLAGLEGELMKLGLDAETARAAAGYGAGNLALSPYLGSGGAINAATTSAGNQMNLFSGITSGLLNTPGLFNRGGSATTSNSRIPFGGVGGYGAGR